MPRRPRSSGGLLEHLVNRQGVAAHAHAERAPDQRRAVERLARGLLEAPGAARLALHAAGDPAQQLAALLEHLERRPQRGLDGLTLGLDYRVLGVGEPDPAALARERAVLGRPQRAAALR